MRWCAATARWTCSCASCARSSSSPPPAGATSTPTWAWGTGSRPRPGTTRRRGRTSRPRPGSTVRAAPSRRCARRPAAARTRRPGASRPVRLVPGRPVRLGPGRPRRCCAPTEPALLRAFGTCSGLPAEHAGQLLFPALEIGLLERRVASRVILVGRQAVCPPGTVAGLSGRCGPQPPEGLVVRPPSRRGTQGPFRSSERGHLLLLSLRRADAPQVGRPADRTAKPELTPGLKAQVKKRSPSGCPVDTKFCGNCGSGTGAARGGRQAPGPVGPGAVALGPPEGGWRAGDTPGNGDRGGLVKYRPASGSGSRHKVEQAAGTLR